MRRIKKKSFGKKISVILLLLLIATGTTWITLANKFEQYVKEELPNTLEKISWLVKVDMASIKVNKYLFNLSTNEVVFWPYNNLYQFTTSGIDCSYNPLSKNIAIKFIGDKVAAKIGQADLYIEHPSDVISFNKSMLDGDLSKLNIKLTAGKTNLKSKINSTDIASFDKADIMIIGEESSTPGNYKIGISSEYKNLHLYAKTIKTAFNMSYELSSGLYLNLLESTGSFDYEAYYSLDLKKDFFHSLSSIQEKRNWKDILNKVDFLKDQYSVNISQKLSNSSINDNGEILISNNGEKISASFSEEINTNYTDAQKQELEAILTDLLYVTSTSDKELALLKKGSLAKQDFDFVASKLINIKNADIKIEVQYDKESENLAHNFALKINDHNLSLEGDGNKKEWLYNGTLKIAEPKKLVSSVADIIEKGFYPIMKKSVASSRLQEAERLKHLANNIKEHGFSALAVLHKDAELKENDELVSNIWFNFKQFEFKLNDKGFIEIITDPRIKPFVEGTKNTDSQVKPNIIDSDDDPYSLMITPEF